MNNQPQKITMEVLFGSIQMLSEKFDERFSDMNERFSGIDERFSSMDEKFSSMDKRFSDIDARFNKLDIRIDKVETRIDNLFTLTKVRFDEVQEDLNQLNWRVSRLEKLPA